MRRFWRFSTLAATGLASALMSLNLAGLFLAEEIPSRAISWALPPGLTVDTRGGLDRRPAEREHDYFRRLTLAVHYSLAHGWSSSNPVPLTENYVLYALRFVSSAYRDYEYTDAERGLRRGYGLCGQFSNVVFDVLDENGFEPRTFLLPRHTVVEVEDSDGEPFILDANYGVVIGLSMAEARRRPEVVRTSYMHLDHEQTPMPSKTGRELGRELAAIYGDPPWAINSGTVTPTTARIEPIAYWLKWTLPIALALAGVVGLIRRQSRDSAAIVSTNER